MVGQDKKRLLPAQIGTIMSQSDPSAQPASEAIQQLAAEARQAADSAQQAVAADIQQAVAATSPAVTPPATTPAFATPAVVPAASAPAPAYAAPAAPPYAAPVAPPYGVPATPAYGAPAAPARAADPAYSAQAGPTYGAPTTPAYGAPATTAPTSMPIYGAAPAAPWSPAAAIPPQPPAYGVAYPTQAPGYPMPGVAGYPAQVAPAAAKKNTGLIVGIVALVVLIIVALLGFHFWPFGNQNKPDAPVTPGQATTASAAVRGYLEALAAGSSADALAFLDSTPDDTTFLTDDVLAVSNASNPISNITTNSPSGTSVTATYNIGSQSVSADFYTTKSGKYYYLAQAVRSVDIPSPGGGVKMMINGVAADLSRAMATLFPGYYVVTVDNPLLTVSDGAFVVSGSMSGPDTSNMSLDLAPDAQGKFQAAAQSRLDGCMAEQALVTSCGFGFDAQDENGTSVKIDNSSIVWSYGAGSSDDFSTTDFTYYGYAGLTALGNISIDIEVDLKSTSGHRYYQTDTLNAVTVDFTDPSNLRIAFSD